MRARRQPLINLIRLSLSLSRAGVLCGRENVWSGRRSRQDLLRRLEEYSGDVSVDCTLTLGTSSRGGVVSFPVDIGRLHASFSSCISTSSSFTCTSSWSSGVASAQKESGRVESTSSAGKVGTARRCATTYTLLWRNGPNGAKDLLFVFWGVQTLCNACGIRFKKEERRTNLGTDSRGMTRSSKKPKVHVYRFLLTATGAHTDLF